MLPKKEARTEPSSLSKTHIPHERTLKDTAHAGPQSAGHCNGGPNRCMKLLPPPAMSTLWSQFERWRWGSTARTPWVNSLQQEDGSHCMMGTRFWEELPESKVENGNNNRKIHSAYLTVLYQETKVVTLQSCIKPVIRMVRPMEVERGACRTGHPEQPAGVLGGEPCSLWPHLQELPFGFVFKHEARTYCAVLDLVMGSPLPNRKSNIYFQSMVRALFASINHASKATGASLVVQW